MGYSLTFTARWPERKPDAACFWANLSSSRHIEDTARALFVEMAVEMVARDGD
jgi:hypothetical protein